jgi:hypothetical protein
MLCHALPLACVGWEHTSIIGVRLVLACVVVHPCTRESNRGVLGCGEGGIDHQVMLISKC